MWAQSTSAVELEIINSFNCEYLSFDVFINKFWAVSRITCQGLKKRGEDRIGRHSISITSIRNSISEQ